MQPLEHAGPQPSQSGRSGPQQFRAPQRQFRHFRRRANAHRHPHAANTPAVSYTHLTTSLRHNRAGEPLLRFSPHFYNTEAEMDRVAQVIGGMA